MDELLKIEEKMGRKRLEKYGSRIIDIDILFFNDAIIDSPRLIIPHPEIQNRRSFWRLWRRSRRIMCILAYANPSAICWRYAG